MGLSAGKNSKGRPVRFDIGLKYFKKELLDQYDNLDVFVHTWNTNHRKEILEVYQPKLFTFEKSDKGKIFGLGKIKSRSKWPMYSNFYSYYQCDLLRQNYEKEQDFKYDCVIATRFDMKLVINKRLEDYDLSRFYFVDLNNKFTEEKAVEAAKENGLTPTEMYKKKRWFMDYLLFSNSDLMTIFTQIYFHAERVQRLGGGGMNTHKVMARYFEETPIWDALQAINPDEFYAFFINPRLAQKEDLASRNRGVD